MPTPAHPCRRPPSRGAVIVEFALVLPLLLVLLLGMFTGGIAYDQSQSLVHGAREAARFGATLPVGTLDSWLDQVAATARTNAAGNLDGTVGSRFSCVALVGAASSGSRVETAAGTTYTPGANCFADGLSGARVQVVAGRSAELDAFVFRRNLDLRERAVTTFEATP